MASMKVKKGVKLKPTDLLKFPWDEQTKPIILQVDESARNIWDKWDAEVAQQYGTSLEEVQKLENGRE